MISSSARWSVSFRRIAVTYFVVILVSGTQFLSGAALAKQPSPRWEITARPYLWLGAAKATADTSMLDPSTQDSTTQISLSTPKLIEGIKIGGMSAIDARRAGLIFILDGAYGQFELSGSALNPTFSETTLELNGLLFNVLGGHTIVAAERYNIHALAGARIFRTEFTLRIPAIQSQPAITLPIVQDTFIDPVVGSISTFQLTERIAVTVYGDIGGFGVSSDLTWQVYGSVGYLFSESVSIDAGYRRLKWVVDELESDVLRDLQASGPVIGLTWRF
jgi:hypothetical protein